MSFAWLQHAARSAASARSADRKADQQGVVVQHCGIPWVSPDPLLKGWHDSTFSHVLLSVLRRETPRGGRRRGSGLLRSIWFCWWPAYYAYRSKRSMDWQPLPKRKKRRARRSAPSSRTTPHTKYEYLDHTARCGLTYRIPTLHCCGSDDVFFRAANVNVGRHTDPRLGRYDCRGV